MNSKLRKQLRKIGHGLKPVVTVAGKGLSDPVMNELNRALDDHELIKVKIVGDREVRNQVAVTLLEMGADTVQKIGGILLVYRPARQPNPALSNIQRSSLS